MTEKDPAAELEREADRLEHHLEELDDQIADAQKGADRRREELDPELTDASEEPRGDDGQGEGSGADD
jgi:predicted  nucleic acid-binding Zn-ribbon protein